MSTLHTVNQSPFSQNTLRSCLDVCQSGDALLLIEEGVYAALASTPMAEDLKALRDRQVHLYALQPDLEARGLAERAVDWIDTIHYGGFVALSVEHNTVQSWY